MRTLLNEEEEEEKNINKPNGGEAFYVNMFSNSQNKKKK